MIPIKWKLVDAALDYYTRAGYQYLEVPWLISKEATNQTLPIDKEIMEAISPKKSFGCLVGSAEQSFIQLMLDKKISSGKYCAATPCFRDDDPDELHLTTFFKVELIDINPIGNNDTFAKAWDFMSLLKGNSDLKFAETSEGTDLMINEIEVGSYGFRQMTDPKISWYYGTGLALPRFTQACQINK